MKYFVCTFLFIFSLVTVAEEEFVQREMRIDPNPQIMYMGDENITVEIPNPKVSSESIDIDRLDIYLEVRRNQKKGIPVFVEPNTKGKIVFWAQPGDILITQVTGPEFEERERFELADKGLWRSIKSFDANGVQRKLYFVDYWRHFLTLYSSSRGVAIGQRPSYEKKPIEVFSQRPTAIKPHCLEQKDVFCFPWKKELGFIYLTESAVLELPDEKGKTTNKLAYFTRFVRPEDGEERWARGWVKAQGFERRVDEPSCIRKRCVTRDLIKNNPEEIRGLFIELGIIKRPKLKKKEANKKFFVSDAMAGKEGEMPFNRWLERMNREKKPGEKPMDEIAYLFDIRPVKEWSLGVGYYSLEQTGDLGDFQISEFGVTANGFIVFPIFLDFELQVFGEALLPLINDNTGADYVMPFEVTNDVLWGRPYGKDVTIYMGPGITFRSMWGSASSVGLSSLFGAHFTLGFFTRKHFGFLYYGFTGRDFNDGTGFPEWSLQYGQTWNMNKKKGKKKKSSLKEGVFGKITGYMYEREDIDLLTDEVTQSEYNVFRATINYVREF